MLFTGSKGLSKSSNVFATVKFYTVLKCKESISKYLSKQDAFQEPSVFKGFRVVTEFQTPHIQKVVDFPGFS